ncbi:MAG TPA: MFS transporter, partial [Candidatus Binatia bacterium]|nr:MFS transporter [Candidatus Binatia bacterium]
MTRPPGRMAALVYPDLRRYLSARFLVAIGLQMLTVAVGWEIYDRTRNPLDLGLIGLSQFLPFIVLILPAGHVADRYDRRRIQMACYLVYAAAALILLGLSLAEVRSTLPVFGVMAVFGTARAFNMPSSQSLLPNLVPPAAFGNAVALNTSLFQLATISGPAVAGLLLLLGTEVVYAVVAALFLGGSLVVVGLTAGGRGEQPREPLSLAGLLSGITFVRGSRPVLGAMSLDLFAVLFGGATALLPAFASDVLHVGPTGLGLLRAAPAVGAAIVGAFLAARPIRAGVGRWLFGGVAVFGAATLVFGISGSFGLSLVALAVLGGADMASMYVRHLLVQLQTPDLIRGRVSAVNSVFIGASNELGEFESGLTAAWWGIVPAVLVGGLATLAVAVIWARVFPVLWHLER